MRYRIGNTRMEGVTIMFLATTAKLKRAKLKRAKLKS